MFKFKAYKDFDIADTKSYLDVEFNINKGEFVTLFGQNGSGKTTLLRIIAGLEKAQATIQLDNKIWQNDTIFLPPQKRKIGFVFQDYALFDNMSVLDNLLYANKDYKLANYLLEITNLDKFKNRFPNRLSGGQKQRVSLCRALMNKPEILLLDEPLSALDSHLRLKLQNEILKLHKEFKTTTIMVSHDMSEIYKLSNKVIVLQDGKITKISSPKDIFLKSSGSSKFAFEGMLLDIVKVDVINIAIISIGQQIVEITLTNHEAKNLKIGQKLTISTKAFEPIITDYSHTIHNVNSM